jgi:hypothetical protein
MPLARRTLRVVHGHLEPGANRQEMNRLPSLKTRTDKGNTEREKTEAV